MQIAAATLEDGLAGGDWEDWANEALELTSKIMSHKTPDALKHILEAHQVRQEEAETALRQEPSGLWITLRHLLITRGLRTVVVHPRVQWTVKVNACHRQMIDEALYQVREFPLLT